jgi:succinate-semialdehyde dehydrogenase/glutarate-semialdehyde dehydrogenase
VQEGIFEAFSAGLAERMQALTVGAGYEPASQCGPLINQDAVERISTWIEQAVARGAKLVTGGGAPEGQGYFLLPTVITDVPADATLMREEIFGPVAAISSFKTEEEAIGLANGSEYGLIAYVFTGDLARGLRVSEKIECGMVGLNRGLVSDPAAPFGGTKQSGLGREGAHHGILAFCETKYIAVDW